MHAKVPRGSNQQLVCAHSLFSFAVTVSTTYAAAASTASVGTLLPKFWSQFESSGLMNGTNFFLLLVLHNALSPPDVLRVVGSLTVPLDAHAMRVLSLCPPDRIDSLLVERRLLYELLRSRLRQTSLTWNYCCVFHCLFARSSAFCAGTTTVVQRRVETTIAAVHRARRSIGCTLSIGIVGPLRSMPKTLV